MWHTHNTPLKIHDILSFAVKLIKINLLREISQRMTNTTWFFLIYASKNKTKQIYQNKQTKHILLIKGIEFDSGYVQGDVGEKTLRQRQIEGIFINCCILNMLKMTMSGWGWRQWLRHESGFLYVQQKSSH